MHECVSACTRAKWCADGVSSAIGALVPRDKQLFFARATKSLRRVSLIATKQQNLIGRGFCFVVIF